MQKKGALNIQVKLNINETFKFSPQFHLPHDVTNSLASRHEAGHLPESKIPFFIPGVNNVQVKHINHQAPSA